MTNILSDYFYAFLHPFELQKSYGNQNSLDKGLYLTDNNPHQKDFLSFGESLSISWGFVLIKTIFILLSLPLGSYFIEMLISSMELDDQFRFSATTRWQFIWVFALLFEAVVYPAFIWFYMKTWGVLIRFFGDLFQNDKVNERSIDQVLSVALTGHIFLLIPIFGNLLKYGSFLVYLFAGLRENLGMTRAQSLVVLASPLFVVTLITLMIFLYFLMLFSIV